MPEQELTALQKKQAYMRQYRKDNAEKVRASKQRYNKSEQGRVTKQRLQTMARYGISAAQVVELRASPCAICGEPSQTIDHDHETGLVRGALCAPCNKGLGHFKDNVANLIGAIEYLGSNLSTKKATV